MSPAASGSKAASLDLKKALLETFAINERANQILVGNTADAAWHGAPPSGKGRTIAEIAAHMHHVRLMWLSAADKSAKLPAKLQPDKVTEREVQASLKQSAAAVEALLQKALNDPAGKVPNFQPNVAAFIGYLVAHDSHHRGQISLLARQLGHPIDKKAAYGLWEWGSLWRDCGFESAAESAPSK